MSKLAVVRSRSRDRRLARKKKQGKCLTPFCRNCARTGRNYCCSCRSASYYERHPIRRLFHNLKTHAKARGKAFLLTFEQFAAAAKSSGYAILHGNQGQALTVDRKDHLRGYEIDNIQFLSHEDNSRKGWYEQHGKPWETPANAQGGGNEPF